MSWRCRGYQKKPALTYRAGEYLHERPLYGLGKCSECGRVVGFTPKGPEGRVPQDLELTSLLP